MPAKKVVSIEQEMDRAVERGRRAAARTAVTISRALDKMFANLDDFASIEAAHLNLVRELTRPRPMWMQQIMDGHLAREVL